MSTSALSAYFISKICKNGWHNPVTNLLNKICFQEDWTNSFNVSWKSISMISSIICLFCRNCWLIIQDGQPQRSAPTRWHQSNGLWKGSWWRNLHSRLKRLASHLKSPAPTAGLGQDASLQGVAKGRRAAWRLQPHRRAAAHERQVMPVLSVPGPCRCHIVVSFHREGKRSSFKVLHDGVEGKYRPWIQLVDKLLLV